jgi:hypothetical protein
MNIIFGDSVNTIPDHYILLELDTFRRDSETEAVTAYCLVEKPAVDELVNIQAYKKIHADVIKYFKQRHWDYCEQAIQGLMGKWGGEMDSFYTDLLNRVNGYKQNEPPADWDGIRTKTID